MIMDKRKRVVQDFTRRHLFANSSAIIMYHSIGVDGGYDNISQEEFTRHIKWLKANYEIVSIPKLLDKRFTEGRQVAITFDDALMSFYNNARPVLKRFSIPAEVFAIGISLDNSFHVNRNEVLKFRLKPAESLMRKEELINVANDPLFTIGAHTCTHPKLSSLNCDKQIEQEILESKSILEDQLDINVNGFAYPYNKHNRRAKDVVSNAFDYAVAGGGLQNTLSKDTDTWLLPRVSGGVPLSKLKLYANKYTRTPVYYYEKGEAGVRRIKETIFP